MKIIRVQRIGNTTHHGIAYTEHDGFAGTSDNRMSIRHAIASELRCIEPGEEYQIEVNGKNSGLVHRN